MNETYICDCCKKQFEKDQTDEEMFKEYEQQFPEEFKSKEPVSIVCDDCYKFFI